jgi:hypothetical protein
MVLSTRDHTLQLGGCEAVSVGQPLITSNWPFLQNFFHEGTVFVENNAEGIREGFKIIQNERNVLQEEIKRLRESGRKEWDCQLTELQFLAGHLD